VGGGAVIVSAIALLKQISERVVRRVCSIFCGTSRHFVGSLLGKFQRQVVGVESVVRSEPVDLVVERLAFRVWRVVSRGRLHSRVDVRVTRELVDEDCESVHDVVVNTRAVPNFDNSS
jgi:hypothetical protein